MTLEWTLTELRESNVPMTFLQRLTKMTLEWTLTELKKSNVPMTFFAGGFAESLGQSSTSTGNLLHYTPRYTHRYVTLKQITKVSFIMSHRNLKSISFKPQICRRSTVRKNTCRLRLTL
jgi:hypothetical protein